MLNDLKETMGKNQRKSNTIIWANSEYQQIQLLKRSQNKILELKSTTAETKITRGLQQKMWAGRRKN